MKSPFQQTHSGSPFLSFSLALAMACGGSPAVSDSSVGDSSVSDSSVGDSSVSDGSVSDSSVSDSSVSDSSVSDSSVSDSSVSDSSVSDSSVSDAALPGLGQACNGAHIDPLDVFTNPCAIGGYCDTTALTCESVCAPLIQLGERCTETSWPSCDPRQGYCSEEGRCVAHQALNASNCHTESSSCNPSQYCHRTGDVSNYTGQCRNRLPEGALCADDIGSATGACQTGFGCNLLGEAPGPQEWRCTRLRELGADCRFAGECRTGSCDAITAKCDAPCGRSPQASRVHPAH